MASTDFSHNSISSKICRSHSASSPALSKAIIPTPLWNEQLQVCLKDFQDSAAPLRVNTYPPVDFYSQNLQFNLHRCIIQVQVDTCRSHRGGWISDKLIKYKINMELKTIMQTKNYYANTLSITQECSRIPGEGLWTISSRFL